MDDSDKTTSSCNNRIISFTNVQQHFTSSDDKKKCQPSDGLGTLSALLTLEDNNERNHENIPSDIEARERGMLALAAYELPAAVVRRILLAYGRHPLVKGVYVSGKLVLPDL